MTNHTCPLCRGDLQRGTWTDKDEHTTGEFWQCPRCSPPVETQFDPKRFSAKVDKATKREGE